MKVNRKPRRKVDVASQQVLDPHVASPMHWEGQDLQTPSGDIQEHAVPRPSAHNQMILTATSGIQGQACIYRHATLSRLSTNGGMVGSAQAASISRLHLSTGWQSDGA